MVFIFNRVELEICVVWGMWEWDYVMYVVYISDVRDQMFEVQIKVCVWYCVVMVQVVILVYVFRIDVKFMYMCIKNI